jgi:hypothetical protein
MAESVGIMHDACDPADRRGRERAGGKPCLEVLLTDSLVSEQRSQRRRHPSKRAELTRQLLGASMAESTPRF